MIGFWKVKDNYGCFSNWYPAEFVMDGLCFKNSEQAFMYLKAKLFNDEESANKILANGNPAICKKYGRMVKNFDSEIFNKHKYQFMYQVCCEKFRQNEKLKNILLATNNEVLVEASPKDKIWGIGMSVEDKDFNSPDKWLGENLLGKVLMQVREKLKENC